MQFTTINYVLEV